MTTPVLNPEILKKLKKNTTAQLLIKVTKAKGEDLDVILDILQKRNQDVSKWIKKELVSPIKEETKTVNLEAEDNLSFEDQAKIDQAEKEYEEKSGKEHDVLVIKTDVIKKKEKSVIVKPLKSVTLKCFIEDPSLSIEDKVQFTVGGESIIGVIKRFFLCQHTGKEKCRIVGDNKKVYFKTFADIKLYE